VNRWPVSNITGHGRREKAAADVRRQARAHDSRKHPMRAHARFARHVVVGAVALALGVGAAPARAQWNQVGAIPGTPLFSLFVNGDTLAAGGDTTVHVSIDGGATWRHSAKPVAGVHAVTAVRVRNGRIFAGTFGQGVFTSDDLGLTWQGFNQGLVGGFADSQLDIDDLVPRGDTMYVATAGAGVYLRRLTPPATWQPTGTPWDPEQAQVVNSIALGGKRLLALAGGNGMVFRNDPGELDWTESDLNNVGIAAGVQGSTAIWTGTGWVVGTNIGLFLSAAGQEPWTPVGLGLGPLRWSAFALQGGHLFAAFTISTLAVIGQSSDGGATWTDPEVFPSVFIQALGISHGQLFAARGDGLWRREQPPLAVPPVIATRVKLALAGPQPFADRATFRLELPQAGEATLELFDVLGRRTGVRVTRGWPAGPSTVSLDARDLAPGVYAARLVAGAAHAELRIVHTR